MLVNEFVLVKRAENTNTAEVFRRARGNNPINISSWNFFKPEIVKK